MYASPLASFATIWDNTGIITKDGGELNMSRLCIACAVAALSAGVALCDDLPWKMEGSTIRTAASECPSGVWSDFRAYEVCSCFSPLWESLVRNEWTSSLSDVKELRTSFRMIISFK